MNSLIGQTVGGYRILEQIGQGGMATVYKAYQPSLDRYVAVKVLPEPLAQRPGFEQRFRREARTVAKLEHPHILAIHDFGQEGDLYYLVMRYVLAGTLKGLLGRPISLGMAAELVGQMAEALDYAHGQGIVHRDVKPSNVLMDRGGWALLTDFGLARMMEPTEQITATGVGIGTPEYMSPEQALGHKVDGRSDIYSLGVVLYEMLTGRVPYQAETPIAVAMKHIHEPLPLPRTVNPSIPEGVERVVLKSMAKAPEDRYSTAGELARALRAAVGEAAAKAEVVGEDVTRDEVVTEPRVQPRRPSAIRSLWWVAASVLGVMAVAMLAWRLPVRVNVANGGIAVAWGTAPPPQPTPLPTMAPNLPGNAVAVSNGTATPAAAAGERGTTPRSTPRIEYSTVVHSPSGPPLPTQAPRGLRPDAEPEGRIVYTCQTFYDSSRNQICIMNADGSGQARLTTDDMADHRYGSPAPDGSGIVFSSNMSGEYEIYETSVSGDFHRLTSFGECHAPAISPDGQSVLFSHNNGEYLAVWVMNRDGTNPHPIPGIEDWNAWDPEWSADGTRVLFASNRSGSIELYTANPDGSGVAQVTHVAEDYSGERVLRGRSDWSPTGEWIAAYVGQEWNWEIFLVSPSGGDHRIVTSGGNNLAPSFSPDGQWITFMSYRDNYGADNGCDIYLMRIDGSDVRRLTYNNYCEWQPQWGP